MKKLLVILIACLVLTGCGAPAVQNGENSPSEPATTDQVDAVSLYDPDSPVEEATGGAVRAYPLGDGTYTGLLSVGERVLVVSAAGDATLLEGDTCRIVRTAATDLTGQWGPMELRSNGSWVAYYAAESREVVLLDQQLQQTQRIALPEDAVGKPAIHLDQGEIFYCAGTEIRALNIQTGISRLVRSHSCQSQELTGSFFDDSVLGCRITDEEGRQSILYLYAQTGQVINQDLTLGSLQTMGSHYFAMRTDGDTVQYLFGTADAETMCLNVQAANLTGALALGGAVDYSVVDGALELSFYNFASGKRTAQVRLDGVELPQAVLADSQGLWILSGQVLYRWDISASPMEDKTVYTGALYTAENPDTVGLADCQTRAAELGQTYGITIRIWQDAVKKDYDVEPEYQVSAIRKALDQIETALQLLPPRFLDLTGELEVDLIRSVDGNRDAVQYRTGSTCTMIIPCQDAQKYFLWGLGWGVDTRTLGNSRDYDFWDDLNPEGFEYTYDYMENAVREDRAQYLEGENRAFVDQLSMSFPTEDRARVFAAAMLEGNEELFRSEIMQAKLVMLCGAVREAYYLEDSTEILPWEQYLNEPLAKEK